jgi:hypothetical protein
VKSHASYAYNDYYQKNQGVGGTCDFDGTAEISTKDPSKFIRILISVLTHIFGKALV